MYCAHLAALAVNKNPKTSDISCLSLRWQGLDWAKAAAFNESWPLARAGAHCSCFVFVYFCHMHCFIHFFSFLTCSQLQEWRLEAEVEGFA